MTDQPEALILAEKLEEAAGDYSQFDRYLGHESAAMLREQHLMLQCAEKIGQQRDRMRAALARIKETKVFLGAIAGEMLDDALKEGIE